MCGVGRRRRGGWHYNRLLDGPSMSTWRIARALRTYGYRRVYDGAVTKLVQLHEKMMQQAGVKTILSLHWWWWWWWCYHLVDDHFTVRSRDLTHTHIRKHIRTSAHKHTRMVKRVMS